jgi:hypothetical protein
LNNCLKLDLSKNGKLSTDDSILINKIAPSVREEYNDFTMRLIKENKLSGLSLLLAATCRNTLASPVYDVFCRAALLEEKIVKDEVPSLIYVDDDTENIIRSVLAKFNLLGYVKIKCFKKKNLFKHILVNIFKSIYCLVSAWFWVRLFKIKKTPNDSVIFIDNFLFIDSFNEKGEFFDRYYTGYDQYLSSADIKQVWYAPTLYGIKYPSNYIKICKDLKKTDQNFLIQEAWLTFTDYVYSFVASLIIPFSLRSHLSYREFDTKSLIFKVKMRDLGSPELMRAIYKFRFIRRLSKNGVDICNVVDWNENQIIDRALNMAFREFYPHLIIKGYQGFPALEYYASLQPVWYEMELNTLPHQLHVISEIDKKIKLAVCKDLDVRVAPAFRYSHIFETKDRRSIESPIILIALPGMLDDCRRLCEICSCLRKKLPKELKFLVKIHPIYTIKRFLDLVPESKNVLFEITTRPISELLELTSVLITMGSSVAVEAVAVGVPAAICGNRRGVTLNYIPKSVPKELWSVSYTLETLEDFLSTSLKYKKRQTMANELFYPISEKSTRELFVCNHFDKLP